MHEGKVLEIRQGNIVQNGDEYEYTYYIIRPDKKILRYSDVKYPLYNAAFQAMREKVVQERRKHLV